MVQEDVLWKHVQTTQLQKTKKPEEQGKKTRSFGKKPVDVLMASRKIKSS